MKFDIYKFQSLVFIICFFILYNAQMINLFAFFADNVEVESVKLGTSPTL